SKLDQTLDKLVDMFKKLSLRSEDNKHRKRHHGIFHSIPHMPPIPRRYDFSKNNRASKIKKYPKVDLGDGCGRLSIKTHLNNIWKSVYSIENDIEYGIFEKLRIIECELSCINKVKLPWIKSETETNSFSSDSESTDSDWYDLNPIKSRKNRVHIKKKKVVSPIRKHRGNKLRNKAY
ncbi:8541_t:CDS:1, partial [Paraglomus occultum]